MSNFGAEKPLEDTGAVEEMKKEMGMPDVADDVLNKLGAGEGAENDENMKMTGEEKLEKLKAWKENPKALSEEGYESFQKYGLGTREMRNPEKMALVVAADMFRKENPELAVRIDNEIREEGLKEKNDQEEKKDTIKKLLEGKSELAEDDVRRIKDVSISVHDAFADPVLAKIQHKAWEWENAHKDVVFERKADIREKNMRELLAEIGF